jgi:hypothetical protein
MKKNILGLILTLIPSCLFSQAIKIGFQSGLGTYNMKDLQNFNKSLLRNLPFDTRIVAEFPSYWYYQPSIAVELNNLSIGILCFYNSTGSRISGKDYSGEYYLDMKIHTNSPGIFIETDLASVSRLKFSFTSGIGFLFSRLNINEHLKVGDNILTNDDYNFKSRNYYFQPGCKASYSWKSISFEINNGYLIQFGDRVFFGKVKPNWDGFRIGISVLYYFKKRLLPDK